MHEVSITGRTRELGFGWSIEPQHSMGVLSVRPPTQADVVGTIIQVEREVHRAMLLTRGQQWDARLFVGDWRVASVWGIYPVHQDLPPIENEWHEGWQSPGAGGWLPLIQEVLGQLKAGHEVRLLLEGSRRG